MGYGGRMMEIDVFDDDLIELDDEETDDTAPIRRKNRKDVDDIPAPSAIAVEERYVERADAGDCVFFRRPKAYIPYKSPYDARRDDPLGMRRAEGVTDSKYTSSDEPRGWF